MCDRDAKTLDGDPSTGRQWTLLRGFLAGLPELPRVLQDDQPANRQLKRIGRPIHRKVNPEKRTITTDRKNSKKILFLSKSFEFVLVCLKYIFKKMQECSFGQIRRKQNAMRHEILA